MTHPRVVILYNHAPSGHSRVALSVDAALKERSRRAETLHVALSEQVNPSFGPFVAKVYLQVAMNFPAVWDLLYDNPQVAAATEAACKFFRRGEAAKLLSAIGRFQPDLIVATQALPLNILAYERRAGRLSTPLAGVVTDFLAHRYWPAHGVDWYAVPSEDTRVEMVRRGFNPASLHVTGIPLRASFAKPKSRMEARRVLGLDPERPVVLVAGGTRGLGRLEEAVRMLLASRSQPTVLVTSGTNAELAARLKKISAPRLFLHEGLEDSMGHLPMSADVLVGKPGGVTASELLALGLPMVIFGAYPGQERANTRILTGHGAAVEAKNPQEAAAAVDRLLSDGLYRDEMSRKAHLLGRPAAAEAVADLICNAHWPRGA